MRVTLRLFVFVVVFALPISHAMARQNPRPGAATRTAGAAQRSGEVEFTAEVTPTDGRAEPVRQLSFYLLRKSMDDIRLEALQLEPAPDVDQFIDGLTVSDKLKAWMKKHHTVQLSGTDFTKALKADDIVDVPEFYTAYLNRNAGYEGSGFPTPKFKAKDRAIPDRLQQMKEDYKESIRKYIPTAPESMLGIESDLDAINPSGKWNQVNADQKRRLDKRSMELAQTQYVVARADTNLDGHGNFSRVAPGNYWVSMLNIQAVAGDVRLNWDVPVMVRAGEATHVDLTNFNAARPITAASRPTM